MNKRFRPRFLRSKSEGFKVEVEPGWADIGYNAIKRESFFGMKLHVTTTFGHLPTAWCLTRATCDDRAPLPGLVEADARTQRGGGLRIWAFTIPV